MPSFMSIKQDSYVYVFGHVLSGERDDGADMCASTIPSIGNDKRGCFS